MSSRILQRSMITLNRALAKSSNARTDELIHARELIAASDY
jgi:hypothetical protein